MPIALLLAALAVLITVVVTQVVEQHAELSRMLQSRSRERAVISLAESIERYYQKTGSFPASTAALKGAGGFEHVQSAINTWQGYAVSPTITDGVWQYQRAVLFSVDPSDGTTAGAYLAANACGTGGYDTAGSWCGAKDSHWYRRETREDFNDLIVTQRARMYRMLQKLGGYYNVNGKFPDKDAVNLALGADSMTSLAALASFGGGAATCTGTYTYLGVPVDCGDMFDLWGGAVGYQFISAKHIVLVSETPIFNASGVRIVVAAEYDHTLL